ncbi:DUF559 domain-containing protein [Corynebacterium sp. TA-R-1]|uniref:DUF559 domain-containing protein n=1 Tax=Corynebacterium stercoris TaxID=2943490 RepID=A0ABT1G2J4_9CORY|nr:DUF559 domain-containing protein [Corynebacterium stercoris]MCP1388246.1 DUF559 domain-containing protein [Corynebacterium stercoris]
MGTKRIDREPEEVREARRNREAEILSHVINLRKLSHQSAGELTGDYHDLHPTLIYAKNLWDALPFHEQRWLECRAASMTSRGAILVGRSAARELGMWVISLTDEPVELAVPSGGTSPRRLKRGGMKYRRMELRDDEITERNGCTITNFFRTFADIARYHGFLEGLIAADYLLYRGYDPQALRKQMRRLGPLHRIATVRRCIDHAVSNSDSPYESLARALLIEAGIGPIQTQVKILHYFVDILIDGWLIIEIDGDIKYEGPDADAVRKREHDRQKQITNKGYVILRYPADFIRRHPEQFIAEVLQAIAARGAVIA